MFISITNQKDFILDFIKYLKTSKNLKMKGFGIDPEPMLKIIENEIGRAAINKFENVKLKLIPGSSSFDRKDVFFPFKVNSIDSKKGKLNLKYLK
ncbi:hypothetical protein [Fusobacterium sp. IOR10]|uniref:hypothetical protein n=1 Tax=Fusobacterium sp. IOR10 TaxID=2665157 RepID=UPI0013D10C64|nr:hypothetical protein [Fusobacterium sp. IOR10]